MTTHHFGTDIDPSQYVETPDTANAGQVKRPAAGTVLKVRAAPTNTDLPDITVGQYGYWSYTTTDVPQIYVSGDNWVTSVGPLTSAEAETSAVNAGVNAAAALTRADNAFTAAAAAETDVASVKQTVEAIAAGGGGTGGGGVTSYLDLTNKPVIPAKAELGGIPCKWNGTAYVVPAGYGQRVFFGPPTADPGVLASDYDEWVRVTP